MTTPAINYDVSMDTTAAAAATAPALISLEEEPITLPTPPPPPPLLPTRGLGNLGNTCYLNSAVQCLRHTKAFADLLCGDTWSRWDRPEREGHALLRDSAALTRALCEPIAPGAYVVPGTFVRTFVTFASKRSDEFYFGAQADSAEALQILLDGIHTQIAREVQMTVRGTPATPATQQYVKSLESWAGFFRKEYSPILDMFYGQTQTRLVCERCGNVSDRYEPWNILKVPIPGATVQGAVAPTLADCLAAAMESEHLEDYACDVCADRERAVLRAEAEAAATAAGPGISGELEETLKRHTSKGPARKEHAISRYPPNLILCLKRFTNLGQKVRARIPYEEDNINLASWRAWPTLQASKDAQYRVTATIEHLGSCRGGHYIMRGRSDVDGSWRIYDDNRVSMSPIGGGAGPDTYILFLERKQ
jgi:ubiquitin C-terminal hydrolase